MRNKIIDKIYFVYDDNPNSEIGNYRCYVDDIKILTRRLNNVPIAEQAKMKDKKDWVIERSIFYRQLPELFRQGGIKVYDVTGRMVNELTPNGVYFIQKGNFVQKIIYLK